MQIAPVNYYAHKNGHESDDYKKITALAQVAGLTEYALVGRHKSPQFNEYIWGGSIR